MLSLAAGVDVTHPLSASCTRDHAARWVPGPDTISGRTSEEIHFPALRQGPHADENQDASAGTLVVLSRDHHPRPAMSQPAPAPAPRSPLASAISNLASIAVLVGLSIATFGYERALQPLYGSAATRYHLNKVVWVSCIVGMFAPAPSMSKSMFAVGALLCAMPQTAYWAAVHTGRLGDPVWGPVITHLTVLLPVLYLGVKIVKELQVSRVQR